MSIDSNLTISFVELGAGTGQMLKVLLDVLNNFSLLNNMIFSIVDSSKTLRDIQMKKINETCLEYDVVLGYSESGAFEILSCEENNLTFIWFPSVEQFLENVPNIDPQVILFIANVSSAFGLFFLLLFPVTFIICVQLSEK